MAITDKDSDSVFFTTNAIIQDQQKKEICPEDTDNKEAVCSTDDECDPARTLPHFNGLDLYCRTFTNRRDDPISGGEFKISIQGKLNH